MVNEEPGSEVVVVNAGLDVLPELTNGEESGRPAVTS